MFMKNEIKIYDFGAGKLSYKIFESFVHFFERQSTRAERRHKKRRNFQLLVHFPRGCTSWSWASVTPGVTSGLPRRGRVQAHEVLSTALPGVLAASWITSWAVGRLVPQTVALNTKPQCSSLPKTFEGWAFDLAVNVSKYLQISN